MGQAFEWLRSTRDGVVGRRGWTRWQPHSRRGNLEEKPPCVCITPCHRCHWSEDVSANLFFGAPFRAGAQLGPNPTPVPGPVSGLRYLRCFFDVGGLALKLDAASPVGGDGDLFPEPTDSRPEASPLVSCSRLENDYLKDPLRYALPGFHPVLPPCSQKLCQGTTSPFTDCGLDCLTWFVLKPHSDSSNPSLFSTTVPGLLEFMNHSPCW